MTFSVNSYENKGFAFKEIPNGTYKVILESIAPTATKDNNGVYYKTTLVITEGDFERQKLFINFTKVNTNEQAVGISISQLRTLAKVIASQNTNDTQLRILCSNIYNDKFTSQENFFAEIMEKGKLEQKPFNVDVFSRKGKPYTDKNTGEVKEGSLSYALNLGLDVERQADEILSKYVKNSATVASKPVAKETTKEYLDDEIPV